MMGLDDFDEWREGGVAVVEDSSYVLIFFFFSFFLLSVLGLNIWQM